MKHPNFRSWLVKRLTALVRRLKRGGRQKAASREATLAEKELFAEIEQWIKIDEAFIKKDVTLEDVAAHFCTNRSYVSRAIKANTGKSYPEYINSIRIEYAMGLARKDPTMRVTDLAREANYTYTTTFSQAFQRHVHRLPSEWLDELRAEARLSARRKRG